MHETIVHIAICIQPLLEIDAKGHFRIGIMRTDGVENHKYGDECVGEIGEAEVARSDEEERDTNERKIIF